MSSISDPVRAYALYERALAASGRPVVLTPYFGGKVRLSRKLLPLMPPLPHYIELFGGSGAVLLNRPRAEGIEVYADLNGPMVRLMLDMRDDYERSLWRLRYTPYSRRAYMEAKARLREDARQTSSDVQTTQEQAVNSKGGWSSVHSAVREWGGEREPTTHISHAGVSANRVGVGDAAYQMHEGGMHGRDGWAPSITAERKSGDVGSTRSSIPAIRQGIGVGDAAYQAHEGGRHGKSDGWSTHQQGVKATGQGGWSQSDSGDTIGATRPATSSARQGLGVDEYTAHQGGMHGGGGFSVGRKSENLPTSGGVISRASTPANRQGVGADAQVVHAHGHAGLPEGFGTNHNQRHPQAPSKTEAARLGVGADEALVRGGSVWGGGHGFGHVKDGDGGSSNADAMAAKQGVATDEALLRGASMYGNAQGFGATRADKPKSVDSANRQGVGVDAQVSHSQGFAAKDGAWSSQSDIDHRPNARGVTEAARLGVDALTLAQASMYANSHSFGTSNDGEVVGSTKPVAAARREGVDAHAVHRHGSEMWGGVGSFGVAHDPDAREPLSQTGAARQGVGVDAETVRAQGMWALPSWGFIRNGEDGDGQVASQGRREGVGVDVAVTSELNYCGGGLQGGSFNTARTNAASPSRHIAKRHGVGVDAEAVTTQSHLRSGGAWGKSMDGVARPMTKALTESRRQGADALVGEPSVYPPGWDSKPSGYVVPFSGVHAVETLLSYPPTKCETLNDETAEVHDLFRAARDAPNALLAFGAAAARSVADAVRIARRALSVDDDLDSLGAWRAIASTWYGAMLFRLKRAQIEWKPVEDVVDAYSHPTSAILAAPSGEGEWLGYCLPFDQTPLTRVSARLQDVEIRMADALDVIAEWRDDPDALIYLDPPYLHSTRKGSGDDYDHEMTDEQHRRMLELVKDCAASVVISGYPSEMYETALSGWRRVEWDVNASSAVGKNGAGKKDGRSRRSEVVWHNYDLDDWRPRQIGFTI